MAKEKKPVAMIARARAAWNREDGGIVLQGQYTKSDQNGSHYRVLVDGGNVYGGRAHWVIARASGGNYSLPDAAMSSAVSSVLNVPLGIGDDDVHYCNWNANWKDIARKNGWTLLEWGEQADVVVMYPDKATAEKILEQNEEWDRRHRND